MSRFDPSTGLAADLDLLSEAVEAAGVAAMRFFGKDLKVWDKGGSPVSEGDFAADSILREKLMGARPGYGWMSEESDDPESRRLAERTWIVDPIDGTRNYISGHKDFAVSVALVENGRPVLAALAAPARRELYTARLGGGAFLNGERIQREPPPAFAEAHFTGSSAMVNWRWWKPGQKPLQKPIYLGSLALRLCLVGTGRFDAALVVNPCHEWDVAAAELFAMEAGADVLGLDGAHTLYNRRSPVIPNLVAAPDPLMRDILGRLA